MGGHSGAYFSLDALAETMLAAMNCIRIGRQKLACPSSIWHSSQGPRLQTLVYMPPKKGDTAARGPT